MGASVAVLPVGSFEQHDDHLPLITRVLMFSWPPSGPRGATHLYAIDATLVTQHGRMCRREERLGPSPVTTTPTRKGPSYRDFGARVTVVEKCRKTGQIGHIKRA